MGLLKGKNDVVNDPFRLKYEGYPTEQYAKGGFPDDNINQNSYESEVQGNPSSQNYEGLPPHPNPKTRLTTQVEPWSLLYLVFYLETMGLYRSKN